MPEAICVPAVGIYAGWYDRPDGSRWQAAVSVGRRPTFYEGGGELLVEAYLLDFAGDLYGEEARCRFVAHLRDEVAFDTVDALIAQMERDVADHPGPSCAHRERLRPVRSSGGRPRSSDRSCALEDLAGRVAGEGLATGTRSGTAR